MAEKLSGPMLAPTSGTTKKLMVLLHGYGSDGNDLISLGTFWRDRLADTMFVAPNAPQPCDINPAGYQWFPVDGNDLATSWRNGAASAGPVIKQFLQDLWAETGLEAKDTLLVGFSQGAMMALDVGLSIDETLMGIIAFSGGLVAPEEVGELVKSRPPVCLLHGAEDDIVPVRMSVVSSEALKKQGLDVTIHISPGAGHMIAPDGIEIANEFIAKVGGGG